MVSEPIPGVLTVTFEPGPTFTKVPAAAIATTGSLGESVASSVAAGGWERSRKPIR